MQNVVFGVVNRVGYYTFYYTYERKCKISVVFGPLYYTFYVLGPCSSNSQAFREEPVFSTRSEHATETTSNVLKHTYPKRIGAAPKDSS